MFQLKQINDTQYTDLIKPFRSSFYQKSYWAEFKEKENKYSRKYFAIEDEKDSVAGAFVALIKTRAVLGKTFEVAYIPRVKFLFNELDLADATKVAEILELIKKEFPIVFVECDYPHWREDFITSDEFVAEVKAVAKLTGYSTYSHEIQPGYTFIKDLQVEDLIASVPSSNAKRNIKRGLAGLEKNGYTFEIKSKLNDDELDQTAELVASVAARKQFLTRNKSYFASLQEMCPLIWYVFKNSEGRIILVNAGMVENSTYYDMYVGKEKKYDDQYLSYVLKYYAFQYLQKNGVRYYDHGGMTIDPKSPKYGFSIFKQHFGGTVISYPSVIAHVSFLPSWLTGLVLKKRLI